MFYNVISLILLSSMAGYGLFLVVLRILPNRLKKENASQREEVLREAERQCQSIVADSRRNAEENTASLAEELEELLAERRADLQSQEEDLTSRWASHDTESSRIQSSEGKLEARKSKIQQLRDEFDQAQQKAGEAQLVLNKKLAERCDIELISQKASLEQRFVDERLLESQRYLKIVSEELKESSKKRAQQMLGRAMARYAPNFVWPKASNVIEVADERIMSILQEEDCALFREARERAEISIQVITNDDGRVPKFVKLAGGFGIFREAARLALNEVIEQGTHKWNHFNEAYLRHKETLENEAVKLGRNAINILELDGIHPEIQKLVGALNWRTSYRQNQWHHTVEVGVLAGILADEFGISADAAKRVGLLHDIGKAIDYRIEGSHAVISGDYADRFGEKRVICDTVMSHHADLLVETPLAYILRAADTLSGARPGARVNLEEGYQIRIGALADVIKSFNGITDMAIMNGGREIHVQVDPGKVHEHEIGDLTRAMTKKIEEDVAYPGQIRVMVTRSFESVTVA